MALKNFSQDIDFIANLRQTNQSSKKITIFLICIHFISHQNYQSYIHENDKKLTFSMPAALKLSGSSNHPSLF
jgi:hypothetical protein